MASDPATAAPGNATAHVAVLLAPHVVAPGESIVVRLLGSVGPNGSWSLETVAVRRQGTSVELVPHVRRVPGDLFTQMVVPLDVSVGFVAFAALCEVRAIGCDSTLVVHLQVRKHARRSPPRVRIRAESPVAIGAEAAVPVVIEATSTDGWVERLEIRNGAHWMPPDSVERDGSTLQARTMVRRPPHDGPRRIEARAIDGQGQRSRRVVLTLPGR